MGKWFANNPEKRQDIFLATKFAMRGFSATRELIVDSSPEYLNEAIKKSLARLGLDYVDLYYVHRIDKVTPIEKTMEALVELKAEGKIKHIGLSECGPDTIRRAHAIHPIACVQIEFSPMCLAIENKEVGVLDTCRELGIGLVCYCPLAHGLMSGAIRSRADISGPNDSRAMIPQLSEGNLDHNLAIVEKFTEMAEEKGVTPAQLTLAWILAQGDDFFPIPGTTKVHRLEENIGSLSVELSAEESAEIRSLSKGFVGERLQSKFGYAFSESVPLRHNV